VIIGIAISIAIDPRTKFYPVHAKKCCAFGSPARVQVGQPQGVTPVLDATLIAGTAAPVAGARNLLPMTRLLSSSVALRHRPDMIEFGRILLGPDQ
jgi:hypothetical protein